MEVLEYLASKECFGRFVSIDHLEDLRTEVRDLYDKGQLESDFFKEWIESRLAPRPPRGMSKAKSILVAATPSPALRVRFDWKGQTHDFTVPPTYNAYLKTSNRTMKLLKEALAPKKYWIARAILPVKLLAVRSGLACYGKNNITYIPRYGSFHTLAALYTDYVPPEYSWQDKRLLDRCRVCKACLKACPTGAIAIDRVLLHAERCIPRHNERAASFAFPSWMDPKVHNALIGCMACQRACPCDAEVIDWFITRGRFSEDETEYILKGEYSGEKAARIDKKLKRAGLDLSVFPRNLKVLLDKVG